jgi:CheY-like chemotaxis protein
LPLAPAGANREDLRLGRPLRVLLVEDDSLMREVISEYLLRDDHDVATAVTAQEGLEKITTGSFDLVVTDLALPGMNGERLAMEIKERTADMPIILLSGFATNGGRLPDGIDAVVCKPIAPGDLWRAVAQVMTHRDRAPASELVATHSS